ncbi:hypothetical protein VSDG_08089 [Cytospora chrysosperma]|uniref:Uncharacterized protein n=1 Tax=Cytospora chrysosperma TaxID=252740 RepID=A0A423VFD1_CYTCH|nr:hypothetical protein VSDG_08089 [Valsa sordida]
MAMAVDQDQRTEAIHQLDLKYRGAMHQTDLIIKDEEARRLKLRVLVLRDDAATLRDQLADKDSRIHQLSKQYDDVRSQLDVMKQTCQDQENQLRSQAQQHTELKVYPNSSHTSGAWLRNANLGQADLQALNNMSNDSTKVLAEKLALSRELAVLKPEIDHLRSQIDHQKDVLAEKLALERQLNSLEVELANEKRATQKAMQRQESRDNEAEDQLQERVTELEKKLAAEQKASEKAKKAQEKQSSTEEELRQQVADLENKLEAEKKASDKARKTHQKVQTDAEEELREKVADLEKKLASEKRAAQKAKRSQDSDENEAQGDLQEKIKELEEQLVSERREAEKARKLSEKEAITTHDQVDMLAQRVEEFKSKLKETRAELKEVRAELTQARTSMARTTTTTTVPLKDDEAKKPLSKTKAAKKRRANDISVDEMMLDTPGHTEGRTKRPAKKRGIEVAAVGEKSTFSITPFLEKSNTINLAETIEEEDEEPSILVGKGDPGAPIIEPEPEATEEIPGPAAERASAKSIAKALKASKSKTAAPGQKKARGKPKAQALVDASSNKNPPLEDVAEEAEEQPSEENVPRDTLGNTTTKKTLGPKVKPTSASATNAADTGATSSDNPAKKKKRKLLGTTAKGTLFDQDEDAGEGQAAAAAPTVAAAAGIKRKPKASTQKGPVTALAKTAFAGKAFSPLKRERRGVGASFLA